MTLLFESPVKFLAELNMVEVMGYGVVVKFYVPTFKQFKIFFVISHRNFLETPPTSFRR
jgi:hypothetical protein